MKFEFWTTPGHTHIKAILEDGDSTIGTREEGAGTQIELNQTTLTYDYEVNDIHPDILGLICMVNFYPFIGKSVTFPFPVSERLQAAFSIPWFHLSKRLEFNNIDRKIPKYTGNQIALSFGGGIDSTAVHKMFPEAFVVHEGHIKEGTLVNSSIHQIVNNLGPEKGRIVVSNQRYVSEPGGWHSWPCSTVTSLLLATDMNIGIILIGAPLGATQLWKNGLRYWDRHRSRKWHGFSGSHWQSVFHSIGIPMFSPIMGTTEIQSMRISLPSLKKDQVTYCIANQGVECFRCTKCLRRDIIRAIVEEEYSPNWENYNSIYIHNFLEARPLFMGHIFAYALSHSIVLPDWIESRLSDIVPIKGEWPMKIFEKTFEFCPQPWSEMLRLRVLEYIEPMSEMEVNSLKQYHLTKGKISLITRVRRMIKPDQFIR